jgi:hypothetical protein
MLMWQARRRTHGDVGLWDEAEVDLPPGGRRLNALSSGPLTNNEECLIKIVRVIEGKMFLESFNRDALQTPGVGDFRFAESLCENALILTNQCTIPLRLSGRIEWVGSSRVRIAPSRRF